MNVSNQLTTNIPEYVRMYFEHQYDRMAKLEDQALIISNLVITLSVVAFTFGFSDSNTKLIPTILLSVVVTLVNLFAIFYINRTSVWVKTHRERAKYTLKEYAPDLYKIDHSVSEPRRSGLSGLGRRKIQRSLHAVLALSSAVMPLILYLW